MNNFKPWIDTAITNGDSQNCYDNTTFDTGSQRSAGFMAGQPASAINVNSALRQANLVVAAIMNVLLPNNTSLSLASSLDDVISALQGCMTSVLYTNPSNNSLLMKTCTSNFNDCVLLGNNLTSGKTNQVILGRYNVVSDAYDFIYACGTADTADDRKNVFAYQSSTDTFSVLTTKFTAPDADVTVKSMFTTGNISATGVVSGSNFVGPTAKEAKALKVVELTSSSFSAPTSETVVYSFSATMSISMLAIKPSTGNYLSTLAYVAGGQNVTVVYESVTYRVRVQNTSNGISLTIWGDQLDARQIEAVFGNAIKVYAFGN